MTTDAQLAPTDDEIHAVVQACRERGLCEFDVFRAVLARWGQPAHSGKPVAWLNPWRADQVTTDYDAYGEHGIALYTAPQPAPAPLSGDVPQKTWALLDELEKMRGANRDEEDWDTLNKRDDELRAALAAQGGKA